MKTYSQRLGPDTCKMHQQKAYSLTPYSRQKQTPRTIGATPASFAFLATRVATTRTQFQSFPDGAFGVLVASGVTNIDYYIMKRFICSFHLLFI
jgi:hypothetical protein